MNKRENRSVWLEYLCFWLLFLVPVVRLFIWKFFKGAESFEKEDCSSLVISAVIFILVMLWSILKTIKKSPIQSTTLIFPLLGFVFCVGLSVFYSIDRAMSLKAFLVLFSYSLYFLILVDILDTRQKVLAFIYLLIACGVVVSFIGINEFLFLANRPTLETDQKLLLLNKSLHYVISHKRICSLFGWPNVLAAFLIMTVPITFALAMFEKLRFNKGVLIFFSTVFFLVLLLTYSVAGVLSLMVGGLVVFILRFQFKNAPSKTGREKMQILFFVLTAIIFLGFVIYKRDYFAIANTSNPRFDYLYAVTSLIAEHPWIGSGWNTFQEANRSYILSERGYSSYAHHSYLQIWAESGILAMVFFISIFVFLFREAHQYLMKNKNDTLVFGFLGAIVALLVENLFSFSFLKPNISFFFWFVLALMVAWINLQGVQWQLVSGIKSIFFVVAIFFFGLIFLFLSLRVLKGETSYYAGIRFIKKKEYAQALSFLEKAKSINPLDSRFSSMIGQLYYASHKNTKNSLQLQRAEKEFLRAQHLTPKMYENYRYLSRIYKDKGDFKKFKEYHEKSIRLAPYLKI